MTNPPETLVTCPCCGKPFCYNDNETLSSPIIWCGYGPCVSKLGDDGVQCKPGESIERAAERLSNLMEQSPDWECV